MKSGKDLHLISSRALHENVYPTQETLVTRTANMLVPEAGTSDVDIGPTEGAAALHVAAAAAADPALDPSTRACSHTPHQAVGKWNNHANIADIERAPLHGHRAGHEQRGEHPKRLVHRLIRCCITGEARKSRGCLRRDGGRCPQ